MMLSLRVKAGLLSLATAAGFGLMSLPARADNEAVVEQNATQSTAVIGDGNTAATANQQTADILQKSQGRVFGEFNNGAGVRQNVDQATGVSGYGNAVGTDNQQNATITQIKKTPRPVMVRPVRSW